MAAFGTAMGNADSTKSSDEIEVLRPTSEPPSAVQLAVGGMTCVACVRTITDAVSELEGVSDISVNQLGKSASAVVSRASLVDSVVTLIEDIGYECQVISIKPIPAAGTSGKANNTRAIALEIKGMQAIPKDVTDALEQFGSNLTVVQPHISDPRNVLRLSYSPHAPEFTIRTIMSTISAAAPVTASMWHPPTADDLARIIYRKEQKQLLLRLLVAVIVAIPIFIIGIVYMSLLPQDSPGRRYFDKSMWVGEVSRGEWVLFILSTPVMFYSAEAFHRRSLQELWFLWRPASRASMASRFFRFGSMNLLISLGVSVAYFSSVAELAISASRSPTNARVTTGSSTYFDSVVFLTMFLLIGRFIEAFSKHQAANAVTLLGQLKSSEALLVETILSSASSLEEIDGKQEQYLTHVSGSKVEKISTDLLELGDIVRIPPGATPPADGIIVSSEVTYFDEGSLTGESRNIAKSKGDEIFVGTINKLRVIDMRVEAIDGETMLEKVIDAVRQGQTKRAPVERIVDVVTAYFVPVVTAIAILTWVIWLSLGLSGVLPPENLSNSVGGWPIWSLEFAISVFVIACPCGIGLAAPTALLVGSGLAAKHGILTRGGGEAFQEASQIDVIVFDKTGTLTEGSEPKVTDEIIHPPSTEKDNSAESETSKWSAKIAGIVLRLASGSSHPLCVSLRNHFHGHSSFTLIGRDIEELPGRGVKGTFSLIHGDTTTEIEALLGNETWLSEHGAVPSPHDSELLHRMKSDGKSVVLLALSSPEESTIPLSIQPGYSFSIAALFAIADPIRPEAPWVISRLHSQGIETWMISGDNQITATAVAKSVGIPSANVIAGVLPQQKAEKIQWLQTLPRVRATGRKRGGKKNSGQGRQIIAMVGDGINDAPALTAADVGIAMGSGSDIALTSAKFVLLSSNLRGLLTLTDLSTKVFNRIKFNFGWATVYNLITLPIAAGVIYPAGHARLNPVWSSLAMALSSTSVVCSSLLLRLYKEPKFSDVEQGSTTNEKLEFEA
ncbi:heavy metal translocatin [Lyophyllum atratum]|nr:heavy metal translocatin [Lyophyllum atratum]